MDGRCKRSRRLLRQAAQRLGPYTFDHGSSQGSELMGWLLAIDGATEVLALALVSPDGAVHARERAGGSQASSTLVPAVLDLMREQGVAPTDLAALGFGRGPGAFTGLRAVCAVVQGLAWGWQRPVLALDSLLIPAEAASHEVTGTHWGAVMDARMGQCYAARYERSGQGWTCAEAPALWEPDALRAAWTGARQPQVLAGNAAALVAPPSRVAGAQDRAAALGRLCLHAWRHGEPLDAAMALPLYVRDKVALTTAERAGLAAAP